jgi:uncharacterized protein
MTRSITQYWMLAAVLTVLPGASGAAAAAEPEGASGSGPTVLHLTQIAERKLARDLLHVDLRAEKTAGDPQAVEAAINDAMAKALATAKQAPGIEIETGSYSVYRDTSKNQWDGSQLLLLKGKDSGALLKLAGTLQAQGLVMANLVYEASHEVVRSAEDELTAEALTSLGKRAGAIADELHLSLLRYRDVTVGNAETQGGPMPRFAPMATESLSSSMPAPVAAAGEATVRVTVNADVLLSARP